MPYADYVFANESEAAAYGELKVRFYTMSLRRLHSVKRPPRSSKCITR